MWLAAWRVHPGKRFWDYAILGDDIVIADQGVAEEYQKIMKDAEVTISKEKSLISFTGVMEFAKRFITDLGTQDLSPVSFKVLNLTGGFVPAFIFQVLRVSLQTSYRLRGGSYRVYTNRGTPKSRRWLRHWLLACSPSGILPVPIDIWFTLPEGRTFIESVG